jgi:Domain of unknown function (DU1801)
VAKAVAVSPTALLDALNHPLRPVIDAVRDLIRKADPAVQEGVKWNAPSFYTTEHFATLHLRSPTCVQVVLHLGAKARPGVDLRPLIAAPPGLLQWKDGSRATIMLYSREDVERQHAVLNDVLRVWIGQVI